VYDPSGKLADPCIGAYVRSQTEGERWGTREGAVVDCDCQSVSRVDPGSILAVHHLEQGIDNQRWNQVNTNGPPECDLLSLTKHEPPVVFRSMAHHRATCKGTLEQLGVVDV
jgi:hypothetical protein